MQDHRDFVVGPLAHLGGDTARVTTDQAALDLLDEPRGLVLALGAGEPWHQVGRLVERDVAALGDQQRVVAGAGHLTPERAHLGGRLEVEVAGVELEPVGVGHRLAGLDAEQDLVGLGILFERVVQVVGGDHRDGQLAGQLDQVGMHPSLDAEAVVHQLAEEALLAEDVLQLAGHPLGTGVVADAQPGLDLAGGTAGGGDQALAVGLDQLAVDARLVEETFEAGQAGEPEQVVHALGGLGQQRHVRERATAGDVVLAALGPADPGALEAAGAWRDVGLHADDRLDPGGLGLLPEVVGPEHVAVVGHRQRRHLHPSGLGEQVLEPGGAVEHGVLGVHVQVHERVGRAVSHRGRTPLRTNASERRQALGEGATGPYERGSPAETESFTALGQFRRGGERSQQARRVDSGAGIWIRRRPTVDGPASTTVGPSGRRLRRR